jgi:uncharacterized protein
MLESIAKDLKRYKIFILAVILLLNIFLAFQLPSLEIDNSLNVWFAQKDPVLKAYKEFKKTFGNDEVIITSLEFDTPITSFREVRKIMELSDSILTVDGVSRIMNISDIPIGLINNHPYFLKDYLKNPACNDDSLSILENVKKFKSVKRFYAEDFRCLVFYTWLDTLPDIEQRRNSIHKEIRDHISAFYNEKVEVNQIGAGIIYDRLNRETLAVVPLIMSLSYALVLLLIYLFTRRILWVILTFVVLTLSNISLFGIMALFGSKPNMVTMAIPPLIVVIGVGNIIHLSRGIEERHKRIHDPSYISDLVSIIIKPILFNALTTAGGFLSLYTAKLQVTREYGIYAAAGVMIAFIYSLLFTALFSGKGLSFTKKKASWLKTMEDQIVRLMLFSALNRRFILILSSVILLIFGFGISRIEVNTNTTDYFRKDHPIQRQINIMQKQLGYFYPADFLISYKDKNWKDKEFLLKLATFQEIIDKDTLFGTTFSVADLVSDSYCLLSGQYRNARENIGFLSQSKLLTIARSIQKSEYYRQLVTDQGKTIRLTVTGPIESAKIYVMLTEYLQKRAYDVFGEGVSMQPAGNLPLYSQSIQYTMHDQISSLTLAIVIILLLIGLLLRSFRLSLLSIPSNLLPVIFILGTMGYLGIRLDLATVTIAAAIIGIIVDDTIHLLYGYQKLNREKKYGIRMIVLLARKKGPAIVFTSITLCLGFFIIGLAGLKTISRPGMLMSLAIFIALFADLMMLPAMLYQGKSKKQKPLAIKLR